MKLDGSIDVAAPADRVWSAITQPLTLARCVPGVRDIDQVDDRTFEGRIVAAVGPIEGDFTFTSTMTETSFPDRLVVLLEGTDSVTKSRLQGEVLASVASPSAGRTQLTYTATISVKGRIAILGEMVLRATAGVIIGQVTRCLRASVEASAPDGSAPGIPS